MTKKKPAKKTKRKAKKKPLTSQQKIAKAGRCERLLADEDLKNAFLDVKGALHEQFDHILPSDLEGMVKIKERLHLLSSVEENLYLAIQDGKLEEFNLAQDKTPFLGDLSEYRGTQ